MDTTPLYDNIPPTFSTDNHIIFNESILNSVRNISSFFGRTNRLYRTIINPIFTTTNILLYDRSQWFSSTRDIGKSTQKVIYYCSLSKDNMVATIFNEKKHNKYKIGGFVRARDNNILYGLGAIFYNKMMGFELTGMGRNLSVQLQVIPDDDINCSAVYNIDPDNKLYRHYVGVKINENIGGQLGGSFFWTRFYRKDKKDSENERLYPNMMCGFNYFNKFLWFFVKYNRELQTQIGDGCIDLGGSYSHHDPNKNLLRAAYKQYLGNTGLNLIGETNFNYDEFKFEHTHAGVEYNNVIQWNNTKLGLGIYGSRKNNRFQPSLGITIST